MGLAYYSPVAGQVSGLAGTALSVASQGANGINLQPNGTTRWTIDASGNLAMATAGLFIEMILGSAPSAPAASKCRLYCANNGGKVELLALFPSGVAQQVAIEP